jgi:hypothetical protein
VLHSEPASGGAEPADETASQPPADPLPRRSRVAVIVVAALALLVAGGVAAAVLVHRNAVATGAAASTTPTTTATPKPSKKPAFVLPAVIGPYSKSADQSKAVGASRAIPVMVLAPWAAVYEETADPTRQLLVTGGFAEVDDPAGQLKNGLGEGTLANGAKATDLRAASTGSVGGVAECVTVDAATLHMVLCAWIGTEEVVEMFFINGDRATTDTLVPTVLDAIVQK